MAANIYKPTGQDDMSLEELRLYHQIMDYRESVGLDAIRLSASLTLTAGRHVVDTRENIWGAGLDLPKGANLHSWSDAPYMADGSTASAMWEAPRRLGTDYPSQGYEITGAGYATSAEALAGWKASDAHNDIITNQNSWASLDWNAIGVGLDRSAGAGPYAGRVYDVWFGTASDPAGPPRIVGTSGADRVTGTDFADIIHGGRGDDTINGGRGHDRLSGQAGDDSLAGGRGDDRLSGGAGADTLKGGSGDDTLLGGRDGDWMSGGSGDDRLSGSHGADTLSGGKGADTLDGGGGPDILWGGAGRDVFVFRALSDSPASGHDTIRDFQSGTDRIDLSEIDANTSRAGHQDFDFIGGSGFSDTAGELRVAHGMLSADVNGDGRADFEIDLGTSALSSHDLIL
jgi:Ca2+-binding RTX toxin-like protein